MTTYKIEGTTMRKILTNLLHDAGIAFEWDGEYLLLRDLSDIEAEFCESALYYANDLCNAAVCIAMPCSAI